MLERKLSAIHIEEKKILEVKKIWIYMELVLGSDRNQERPGNIEVVN